MRGTATVGSTEPDAIGEIIAERCRQVQQEGWTFEHDDSHENGELARAAACYALFASNNDNWRHGWHGQPPVSWPWDAKWWKPQNRRRDLIKAGALILAEIERIDRAHDKELARDEERLSDPDAFAGGFAENH